MTVGAGCACALSQEPFARKLGTTVGQYLRRMATDHGIGFDMGCVVTEFRGTAAPPSSDDQPLFGTRNVCQAVVQSIDDGRQHVVPCDVVVIGCGITLNTHYLRGADGIQLDANGAVLADECLKVCSRVCCCVCARVCVDLWLLVCMCLCLCVCVCVCVCVCAYACEVASCSL